MFLNEIQKTGSYENAPEILQADEAGRRQQVPLRERDAEGFDCRVEADHTEKEDRHGKEDPGVDRLLGLDGAFVEDPHDAIRPMRQGALPPIKSDRLI